MIQTEHIKRLNDMIRGYWTTQALYVAAQLDISNRLAEHGPLTAERLAALAGVEAEPLYRVLRALASVGVFVEEDDGRFDLTPLAEVLGTPGARGYALIHGKELYESWGNLLHVVQTGQPAFQQTHGMPLFEYMAAFPDRGQLFDDAMEGHHGAETAPMMDAYDLARFREVVDVGGGNGSALIAMLERYPHLRGVLFDLPEVVDRARADVERHAIGDRCRVVGGSFFDEVPAGADVYVLRHVIHDWGDDDAVRILTRCREAAAPDGKVLVVELVVPRGNDPAFAKWLDLMMMSYGGKERTSADYRHLFAEAGLIVSRVVPTSAPIHVIEGVCRPEGRNCG